jgi:arylsulfatase A-like enzyme
MHFKIFFSFLIIFSLAAIHSKRLLLGSGSPLHLKLALLSCVILIAVFITWLLRNKVERIYKWINIIQDKITPLVWIFGIFLIISVPLVTYHTWIKQTNSQGIQRTIQNSALNNNRPNIVLVTFDALTAENMSVYGYDRETTPFISKWAKNSSVFTMAEAESNYTTPTAASLMSGKRLWTHQTYHPKGAKPVRIDIESLPLILKNNGYFNMAFVANSYASVENLGVDVSFDVTFSIVEFHLSSPQATLLGSELIEKHFYQLFSNKIRLYDWILKEDFIFYKTLKYFSTDYSFTRVPPNKAFNRFIEMLDHNSPEPYFAWIHVLPPHSPYLPPKHFQGMFNSSNELRTWKSQKQLGKSTLINILKARYDEFIRYCDKEFENFITELEKRNLLDNLVIILSSDHGETFEHGYGGHGGPHLYEQLTHIPLIIKQPGQTQGKIINDVVEQVDIPATILDLIGTSVPSWMEGQSLMPIIRGETSLQKYPLSMALEGNHSHHPIDKGTIAVWEGDYKLIHYLQKGESLLFNIKRDPKEEENLADEEPEISQRLLSIIKKNLNRANSRINRNQ